MTFTHGFVNNFIRVAMAQGKQGIWLLTFPDGENTGNLVNFFHRENCANTENFKNLEFFGNFVNKVSTR